MSDKAKGKMTVFKTDRHEDVAGIVFVSLVVVTILIYMAYIVPTVTITPGQDGKIVAVKVATDQMLKKGDPIYVLEYKDKKFVGGQLQEKLAQKEIKSAAGGKVLSVDMKEGQDVKKGKSKLLVLEHEKGTLP